MHCTEAILVSCPLFWQLFLGKMAHLHCGSDCQLGFVPSECTCSYCGWKASCPLVLNLQVELLVGPVSSLACLESEPRGQRLTSDPIGLTGPVVVNPQRGALTLTSSLDCRWRCWVPRTP